MRRCGLRSPCGAAGAPSPRGSASAARPASPLRPLGAARSAGGVCGVIPGEGIAGHVSAAGPPRDRPAGRARQQRAAGTGGRVAGWRCCGSHLPPRSLLSRSPGGQHRAAAANEVRELQQKGECGGRVLPAPRLAGHAASGMRGCRRRGRARGPAGPKVTELRVRCHRGPAVTAPRGAPSALSPACGRARALGSPKPPRTLKPIKQGNSGEMISIVGIAL